MFQCELCKREFDTLTKLVSHLTHPKSQCKTDIKEYYNQYYRKENEGICVSCGAETRFISLRHGYGDTKYCKRCKNLNPDTQKKRSKQTKEKREKKKINSGYYDRKEVCQICEERFNSRHGLAKHICQTHKDEISVQEYYDKYFKKESEGICPETGEPTRFKNMIEGYFKFSGKGTNSKSDKTKEKKFKTLRKNYGVDNPIYVNPENRIKKYKETRAKERQLKKIESELETLQKIRTIDENDKFQCQICGEEYNNLKSITSHIIKNHSYSIKDYYDKFFKGEIEGICPISGNPTVFHSLLVGYRTYAKGYAQKSEELIERNKQLNIERNIQKIVEKGEEFGVEVLNIYDIGKVSKLIKFRCLKCGTIYENRWYNIQLNYGKCLKCHPRFTHVSKGEEEVFNFIKESIKNEHVHGSYFGLIRSQKTGRPLELDVYIPSRKLAIEYNGIYWHSSAVKEDPVNYHLHKTEECEKLGIRLIHIFEDEWKYKQEIVKSRLAAIIGYTKNFNRIHARKCTIHKIDSKTKNTFLEENHIQGPDASKIKLGAFYKDELVSVMTFGHGNISRGGKPDQKNIWELSRFCSKLNHIIPGIAGKFLKYFQRNNIWTEIYSYADRRWSNGHLYLSLGFKCTNISRPNYWYITETGIKRIHRFNLRKKPDEPKDIPEWKLRYDQGFQQVWDCGNIRFSLYK